MHALPQLRKLERKYRSELVVLGVHSPNFIGERETESVRQAILRLNPGHTVVNDRDLRLWQEYSVRAWPTLMFVDPEGKVIGTHEGEFVLEQFDRLIATMIEGFDAGGVIDRRQVVGATGRSHLQFPGRLLAEASGRLLINDTGHNRIIVAELATLIPRIFATRAAVNRRTA